MRQCGDCTLCCRLLPVNELQKKAGERCKHQSFANGCAVYNRRAMPACCSLWNCRWLANDDTAKLSRPDRSHYVVDLTPDFITMRDNKTGEETHIEVIQIWCDPRHPDAHRDAALRAYLVRRAEEGIAALVRYNSKDAFTLIAPPLAGDNQWHEVSGSSVGRDHTIEETIEALSL